MSDDHWIVTLYRRYVQLYGEPKDPAAPSKLPVNE
jgi:hypothetical protein